jgi:hypothetical protein
MKFSGKMYVTVGTSTGIPHQIAGRHLVGAIRYLLARSHFRFAASLAGETDPKPLNAERRPQIFIHISAPNQPATLNCIAPPNCLTNIYCVYTVIRPKNHVTHPSYLPHYLPHLYLGDSLNHPGQFCRRSHPRRWKPMVYVSSPSPQL